MSAAVGWTYTRLVKLAFVCPAHAAMIVSETPFVARNVSYECRASYRRTFRSPTLAMSE